MTREELQAAVEDSLVYVSPLTGVGRRDLAVDTIMRAADAYARSEVAIAAYILTREL